MKFTLEQLLSQKFYPNNKNPPSHSLQEWVNIQQRLLALNTATHPHLKALRIDIKQSPSQELRNELRRLLHACSERVALIQLIDVFLALKNEESIASQNQAMA